MASQSRQNKGNRKPGQDPQSNRRAPAWGQGARASPTFSSGPPRQQQQQQQQSASPASPAAFPPLAQPNGGRSDNPRDRVLQLLSGLIDTTIVLSTKTGQHYEGVVISTSAEGDTTGVTLKDVKEISNPGAPLKDTIFIASTNIESHSSVPADTRPSNGDSFRTDTDISQKKSTTAGVGGRERELQAWVPSNDALPTSGRPAGGLDDEDTFGLGANGNPSWDQFDANEKLFGVKASFDEEAYTTKIDRSAPDFKDRERRAQKIANEIIGAVTSNPHMAEERGLIVDDSGANEEDKYGAVVRSQNAYVPPGARKAAAVASANQPALSSSTDTEGTSLVPTPAIVELPRVSINGPDATPKATSPAPAAAANKPPADPLPAFRDFVTNEKQRLTQKRQALVKSEMDKRMAELLKFSKSFKLNKPIPDDLVPILTKNEDKQRHIKEKALQDASSTSARAIGPSTPATASRGVAVAGAKMSKLVPPSLKPMVVGTSSVVIDSSDSIAASGGAGAAQKSTSGVTSSAGTNNTKNIDGSIAPKKIPMTIPAIPPYRGGKKTGSTSTSGQGQVGTTVSSNGSPAATGTATPASNGNLTKSVSPAAAGTGSVPLSPTSATNKLNANALLFRPNPKANAFTPVVSSPKPASAVANAVSSPKPKESSALPNPFFGSRPVKKSTPVHVKDDFNPFKHNKVVDASQVSATWPYSGKRYTAMYPAIPHQPAQQPSHMVAPVHPPPIPPPSYEEDSAAQAAAARGYVYAYPPYGYQPPPMMQGMAPPGPPGAYIPSPYMQPMPYPPGMPPPNAMYSPAMGQMPPPQAYMQPPPGSYAPPPPNGAGPRPSMPPTPIPAPTHPYYHQSPQMQHAYPMMMHPPPNMGPGAPPHGYDGAPAPVPMGGHG